MNRAKAALRALPANTDDADGEARIADRLCFDRFALTPEARLLTRDGVSVEIGGRSLDLLLALLEQPGRVVPKQELFERVWPGAAVVEDATLRFHMTNLRKILGDGKDSTRFITTQVGVGYAFVGTVRRGPITAGAPPSPIPETRSNLPDRPTPLIDRARDIHSLIERATEARLLTIVGAPGVGKTSVAIETAHALAAHFADGADFVDFSTVEASGGLASALLATLGAPSGEGSTTELLNLLRHQRRLLVLDTAEHQVQPLADLVERIGAAAPEVRLIVTSRQALRARNEHVHRLTPHALPTDMMSHTPETLLASPAVQLFLHHAHAAGGVIGEDLESLRVVARICARLDGVALPVELAAVRAATHGLAATEHRLGDRLSLFWPGRRTASPRQRTLQASLDWSYDLLSETARVVFERLSLLADPVSLDAALELLVDDCTSLVEAVTALDDLAEQSLIQAHDDHYHLSETTRAYARERLRTRMPADSTVTHLPQRIGVSSCEFARARAAKVAG